MLESSGGKNKDHERLTTGVNAGQKAGGAFGIVPNSARDFVRQAQNRQYILPEGMEEIKTMPAEDLTNKLNNDPEFDNKVSDLASELLLQKAGQSEERAAYGWRRGHNIIGRTDEDTAKKDPYVQKYLQLKRRGLLADSD